MILYNNIYSDDIIDGVVDQLKGLEKKVDALALGTFYGFFPNSESLPADVTTQGYAYVGLDNPYKIWNFNGESWLDSGTSIDMDDADEEDITRNADGKLQFKDRAYGDGMGYVILRKDKSFAEQVTETNTIYEVRYDFDLGGELKEIPANCVLKFNGGQISNGILNGSNTFIDNVDTLSRVFDSITLKGTFANKQNSFKWWGAVADDSAMASHNGEIFTYLLENHPTIEIDGNYYLSFSEVNVSNKISLYGSGHITLVRGSIIPAEGFSFVADNVSFKVTSTSGKGFIFGWNIPIIIDQISIHNCHIEGENTSGRFIYITFADLDLSHIIGIRTLEFINNNVANISSNLVILDCQFIDSVSIKGNSFMEFAEAPIYIATTNEKKYAGKRNLLSSPIQICNNSFVCKNVCTDALYHCSCVIECNTLYFNGNYIEGIASIYGNEASAQTAYDAYLSVKTLYYTDNTIKNVMGWRNDGQEKTPGIDPITEIFKCKGANTSTDVIRVIQNNYFEIEKSWLENNKVPDNCNSINLFVFNTNIHSVFFENNVINIPATILGASTLHGVGNPVRHYHVNNNNIICKEMKGTLCAVNNNNSNFNDVSIECLGNKIKVSAGLISLIQGTMSKGNTPIDSAICKNNECNAFALVTARNNGTINNLVFEHTFSNRSINTIDGLVLPYGNYQKYKFIFDEVWGSEWVNWAARKGTINNWSFAKKITSLYWCKGGVFDVAEDFHLNCSAKYMKNGKLITHGASVDYVGGEYSYTIDGVTTLVGTSWNTKITLLDTDGMQCYFNKDKSFYIIPASGSWDYGTYFDLNWSIS